jgi:hypothetical protein
MPLYFEALNKRSAIVVGPTANALNVIDAEADRGYPAPASAAAAACCALPEGFSAEVIPLSLLLLQFLRVRVDGLRVAPEDKTADVIPLPILPRKLLRVHADGLRVAPEDKRPRLFRSRHCCGSCFVCTPTGCALPRRTKRPKSPHTYTHTRTISLLESRAAQRRKSGD